MFINTPEVRAMAREFLVDGGGICCRRVSGNSRQRRKAERAWLRSVARESASTHAWLYYGVSSTYTPHPLLVEQFRSGRKKVGSRHQLPDSTTELGGYKFTRSIGSAVKTSGPSLCSTIDKRFAPELTATVRARPIHGGAPTSYLEFVWLLSEKRGDECQLKAGDDVAPYKL